MRRTEILQEIRKMRFEEVILGGVRVGRPRKKRFRHRGKFLLYGPHSGGVFANPLCVNPGTATTV
jgi:hypothetical protein